MDGIFGRDKEARGDSAQRRAATAVLLVDFREMGGLSCRELKLDLSSDFHRFQTGFILSQQHRPSCTDITNQTGFKKAVEGNTP